MRIRFLTVLPVVAFVLTLVLAVPAWAAPNLSITKDGPSTVELGQTFTYAIVVRNNGDAAATGVVVRDRLPEGVTVQSAPAICNVTPDPQDPDRERVTCTVGTLGRGDSRRIELRVEAPNRAAVLENRATVDRTGGNQKTSNTVTTRVAPKLVINKLDDPDPVRREDLLLYTLRITNQGNQHSGNFVIIDDLPLDELDFMRVRSEDFACEEDGGLVRCDGNLASDRTGTVDILVEAEEVGTIENTAEVRAGGRRIDADTESTRVEAGDGGGGGGGGGTDDLDCADFNSQQAAQDELEEDRSDPNNLDADNDGRACEDFDYGGDGNNDGSNDGNNDGTGTNTQTTTPNTNDSALDTTTADDANALNTDFNRPDSGSFRCDLFLRVVSDDQGALRDQYRDDDLIVQRFEQCLSEDVLADTIPNRNLPFTGGIPMLFLAAIGLASLFAGASLLRAVMRRGG
jgi:uncharacterized repeat protein (TIGR01451 family)